MNLLKTLTLWLAEAFFYVGNDEKIVFCVGNRAKAEAAFAEDVLR